MLSKFRSLISLTEILSYVAAGDIFLLGFFSDTLIHQIRLIRARMNKKKSNFEKGDAIDPIAVCVIAIALAIDITLFYNYTSAETWINNCIVLGIGLFMLDFRQKIMDDNNLLHS